MNGRRLCLKLPQLKTLIESNESCVVVRSCFPRTLVLTPANLDCLKEAVREKLDSRLAKYDTELEGIVLSYRNVKILDNLAPISDDCKLRLDITADFYVFQPKVGSVLKGVVHEKTHHHIGCLVHSIFNISIPRVGKIWYGDRVSIGDEIYFTVELLNFRRALPYIRGKLCKEELMSDGLEGGDEEKEQKKKKKKKKKKIKEEKVESELDATEIRVKIEPDSDDHSKSLCRKKKKKDSYREEAEVDRKPLKSCLKRKRSDSSDQPSETSFSSPKKKKIKDEKEDLIQALMIKREMEIGSPSYRQSSDSERSSGSRNKKKKSKRSEMDSETSRILSEALEPMNGCYSPTKKKKSKRSSSPALEPGPSVKEVKKKKHKRKTLEGIS